MPVVPGRLFGGRFGVRRRPDESGSSPRWAGRLTVSYDDGLGL
ncbi:hypothetical protein [Streptomyces sp. NPDC003635]